MPTRTSPPRSIVTDAAALLTVLALWYLSAVPAVEVTAGMFTSQAANASTVSTAILEPPDNVQATAAGSTSIDLTWSATTFPHPVTYEVYRSEEGGPFGLAGTTGGTFFEDTGLTPDTEYSYVIRATYENWTSAASEPPASATTDP